MRLVASVVREHASAGVSRPICVHRLAEQLAVLGLVDGVGLGADHLDAEFVEHARRLSSASAVLSAVCPPMVGSSASGRAPAR